MGMAIAPFILMVVNLNNRRLRTEVFSAASANGPAPGVQRATFLTRDVHGAGKQVGDYGAASEDGGHERNLSER